MKYSVNKKLDTLLNMIEAEIFERYDDEADVIAELKSYCAFHRNEPDYNYAQHGCARIYYSDVYSLYREAGYTPTDKYTEFRLWETYRRQVGYVIREILKAHTAV
jgi:hypothetical protein